MVDASSATLVSRHDPSKFNFPPNHTSVLESIRHFLTNEGILGVLRVIFDPFLHPFFWSRAQNGYAS